MGMDSEGKGGETCTHAQSGWGVLLEGCMKSSDLPICLSCLALLSPSFFASLPTYFSLMSAPSTHPRLCFCLHGSSFRKRSKRRGGKDLPTERVTVNVGPEQIAQSAKHSLLGSTLTSIWRSLRVFCSSMWQLGCQIKLGKAGSRANLFAAISRHHLTGSHTHARTPTHTKMPLSLSCRSHMDHTRTLLLLAEPPSSSNGHRSKHSVMEMITSWNNAGFLTQRSRKP